MLGSGITNPAFINQLQQIQRLHAQNSRLIGDPSVNMSVGRFDPLRPRFPVTGN